MSHDRNKNIEMQVLKPIDSDPLKIDIQNALHNYLNNTYSFLHRKGHKEAKSILNAINSNTHDPNAYLLEVVKILESENYPTLKPIVMKILSKHLVLDQESTLKVNLRAAKQLKIKESSNDDENYITHIYKESLTQFIKDITNELNKKNGKMVRIPDSIKSEIELESNKIKSNFYIKYIQKIQSQKPQDEKKNKLS